MFEKITEKMEKIKEKYNGPRRIELGEGKELAIRLSGEEPEVKLCKGDRELFDLKSLAPEGTKLEFDIKSKWRAYPKSKLVKIGKYEDMGFVLSLLHEFGHLHNDLDNNIVYSAKEKHLQEKMKDRVNNYNLARLSAMNNERKAVLRAERSAWAFALREIRRLEQKYKVKIFAQIGSFEDIRNFLNKHLGTYEQGYLDELYNIDIFTKEEMKKLFEMIEGEGARRMLFDANMDDMEKSAK